MFWRAGYSDINNVGPHKRDLKMKCFCPISVNELSDADMERHVHACQLLLETFPTTNNKKNFMFTDECALYCSSHSHIVIFWVKENPHFLKKFRIIRLMLWFGQG
ncbi:hypothetical protein C0J52_03286 [Blattella germanica]|nr:hypothetical protein C0J52_03286 [Blattella germanica]